jgi:hypothetical protein
MNENPDLHFTFTMQEANAVLAALQELPAKISNPLSKKMTDQATEQIEKIKADMASDVTDVE